MNLIKNVDGDWNQSKTKIRQDLDTIQRNVNQILAQINTPTVEQAAADAIISASNHVTTYNLNALTSVAVKPGSALSGSGTITDPLDVVSPILYSLVSFGPTLWTANATQTLIAAPGAGKFLVPVGATVCIHKPGATFENAPIPSFTFIYSGAGATAWANGIAPGTGAAWTTWYSLLTISLFTDFANARDNQGLTIVPNFAGGAWFPNGGGVTFNIGILYTIQSL